MRCILLHYSYHRKLVIKTLQKMCFAHNHPLRFFAEIDNSEYWIYNKYLYIV